MLSIVFWGLALSVSISLLWARNLIVSILLFGLFGTMTSGAYLLMGAPDVSFASLALGAGFTTFVFIISVRKTGKIKVGYVNTPYLIDRKEEVGYTGFEYELISGFAKEQNLDLDFEVITLEADSELKRFDLLMGGLYEDGEHTALFESWNKVQVLETRLLKNEKGEIIDLMRYKHKLMKDGYHDLEYDNLGKSYYFFLIEKTRTELADSLKAFIDEAVEDGRFEEWIRRNLG